MLPTENKQGDNSNNFGMKGSEGYFCTPKKKRVAFAYLANTDDLVAQLVEHNTFNVGALGSSPSGITTCCYKAM